MKALDITCTNATLLTYYARTLQYLREPLERRERLIFVLSVQVLRMTFKSYLIY